MAKKKCLVLGAGGFIGTHVCTRLRAEGCWVRGIDLKAPSFSLSDANEFSIGDLRDPGFCLDQLAGSYNEVYQFAADMGGAEYLFAGDNDASIMTSSAAININVLNEACRNNWQRLFFASSACVYPLHNQLDPSSPYCGEHSVIPAEPDSEYGWEKLFSERLYLAHSRNYGFTVRIARYHNVYGPLGTWRGGREKVPAAICRKVGTAVDGDSIEVIGDGNQTRSFLYIDDCVDATLRLIRSDVNEPLNVGSEEMVSIRELIRTVAEIAGKTVSVKPVPGPTGVRGRVSDNRLIRKHLNWNPRIPLREGLARTYAWIASQQRQHARITHGDSIDAS